MPTATREISELSVWARLVSIDFLVLAVDLFYADGSSAEPVVSAPPAGEWGFLDVIDLLDTDKQLVAFSVFGTPPAVRVRRARGYSSMMVCS